MSSRLLLIVLVVTPVLGGCRTFRRLSETRQSIAARRLSGQGFQAIHDGRWDIAETLFSDALDVSKVDDRAHWGLAEAYWNRGDLEQAISQMEQAVQLSAGDPKFVRRLGEMYLALGRLEDADQQSLLALQSNRDSAEAWRLRGDCLRKAKRDDDALAAYHRALALQPDFPEAQLQAAEIYQTQNRFDRLLATVHSLQDHRGAEHTPAQVDYLMGIAMRELGRPEEAYRSLVRATQKDPGDVKLRMDVASLAIELGYQNDALIAAREALRLDPVAVQADPTVALFIAEQQRIGSFDTGDGADDSQLR